MSEHFTAKKYSNKIEWKKQNPNKNYASISCILCDVFLDDFQDEFYVVNHQIVVCPDCFKQSVKQILVNVVDDEENANAVINDEENANAVIDDEQNENVVIDVEPQLPDSYFEENENVEPRLILSDSLNYFNQLPQQLNNSLENKENESLENQKNESLESKSNAFTSELIKKISSTGSLKSNQLHVCINIGLQEINEHFKKIKTVKF